MIKNPEVGNIFEGNQIVLEKIKKMNITRNPLSGTFKIGDTFKGSKIKNIYHNGERIDTEDGKVHATGDTVKKLTTASWRTEYFKDQWLRGRFAITMESKGYGLIEYSEVENPKDGKPFKLRYAIEPWFGLDDLTIF